MGKFGNLLIRAFQKIVQTINFVFTFFSIEFNTKLDKYILGKGKELYRFENTKDLPVQVASNSKFPAGKTLLFDTDSSEFIIEVIYKKHPFFAHMSLQACCGIDLYSLNNNMETWLANIHPVNNVQMKVKRLFIQNERSTYKMYLPSFAEIYSISVYAKKESLFRKLKNRPNEAVVYGSSISQGCGSSRAGLSFVNILQRELKINIANYGFSEGAKGETEIIKRIADKNCKLFLIEYDHNASLSVLSKSHLAVYNTIRSINKSATIIFLSRFSGGLSISENEEEERIKIIEETINYSKNKNDNKTFFLCGKNIFPNPKSDFFIDDRHPNDLGMRKIADYIMSGIGDEFEY